MDKLIISLIFDGKNIDNNNVTELVSLLPESIQENAIKILFGFNTIEIESVDKKTFVSRRKNRKDIVITSVEVDKLNLLVKLGYSYVYVEEDGKEYRRENGTATVTLDEWNKKTEIEFF